MSFIALSQKYIPSIVYGSKTRSSVRIKELLSFVGKDIVIHYKDGRTDRLAVHNYEGPYLFLIAPKSSLGHIAIEVDQWTFKTENGMLNAYPKK